MQRWSLDTEISFEVSNLIYLVNSFPAFQNYYIVLKMKDKQIYHFYFLSKPFSFLEI